MVATLAGSWPEAPMNCSQCSQVLRDDARFCDGCGLSVIAFDTPTERGELASGADTLCERDPLIGQTLDGKYELLARLGAGGMGAVYRARRVSIGDEVAVKVLLQKLVADTASLERFRREARAAAMLRHPNVVAIYDYGEAKGDAAPAYIVMELLEGRLLRRLLQQEGRLQPMRAITLMRDICAGVGAAHRRGVFHRDLKPDNVIVLPPDEDREREIVKVVDFGIAKLRDAAGVSTLTETGTFIGTPIYMSPEQCRGDLLDARSDVYSLGAMLYEMLAGAPPFMAESLTGVIAKHLFDEPPRLAKELSAPPALEAILVRALAKKPEDRQVDATVLGSELRSAADEQARWKTQARRPSEDRELREGKTKKIEFPSLPAPLAPSVSEEGQAVATPSAPPPESSPALENFSSTAETAGRSTGAAWGRKTELIRLASGKQPIIFVAGFLAVVLVGVAGGALLLRTPADKNTRPVENQSPENHLASKSLKTPPPGMVYVPGGEFKMGRDGDDEYERPAHPVTVKPFFIDIHEVTCGDYEKFVGATGRRGPVNWRGRVCPPGATRKPATGVMWDDAKAFCEFNGKRLPTEAEWEFAARGSDERRYPWGNKWQKGLANANGASAGLSDVGAYKGASPFGALDMVGNAWEWTADELRAYPGGRLSDRPEGDLRVIRGGSYASPTNIATTTYRSGWPARGAETYDQTGFRCVKDAGGQ